MALIAPTNPQVTTQPLLLTAYWNTEKQSYAIAFIYSQCADTPSSPFHLKSIPWCRIMDYLSDESINLRLVCRAFTHPSFYLQYLSAPLKGGQLHDWEPETILLFKRLFIKSNLENCFSNKSISCQFPVSSQHFEKLQTKFPLMKIAPALIIPTTKETKRIVDTKLTFPSATQVKLCNSHSAQIFNAIPHVESLYFANHDWTANIIVCVNWEPIFLNLKKNSLIFLDSVVTSY